MNDLKNTRAPTSLNGYILKEIENGYWKEKLGVFTQEKPLVCTIGYAAFFFFLEKAGLDLELKNIRCRKAIGIP